MAVCVCIGQSQRAALSGEIVAMHCSCIALQSDKTLCKVQGKSCVYAKCAVNLACRGPQTIGSADGNVGRLQQHARGQLGRQCELMPLLSLLAYTAFTVQFDCQLAWGYSLGTTHSKFDTCQTCKLPCGQGKGAIQGETALLQHDVS